ncbi:MAG: HAMP domain-containing histidine kinase [Sphingobacteriaceae bacterium]|nr:HAMP domain-containing histidine kinase [Cytophagaceae bacterium]
MSLLKRHLVLILSLLLLGLGGILYLGTERGPVSATETQYLRTVQRRVLDELRQSNVDLLNVQSHFSLTADTSFTRLSAPTRYPYFLFRNGRLVYWSDYRFVPPYRLFNARKRHQVVEWEDSQYLANRRVIRQKPEVVEVVSLIPLYQAYRVDNQNLTSGYNPALFHLEPRHLRSTPADAAHNVYARDSSVAPTFLFSLEAPRREVLHNQSVPNGILSLWVLAALLLGVYVFSVAWRWRRRRHYEAGFLLLAAYLFGLRAVMLYYTIPFTFQESDVFNPAFYASSVWSPSLGDLGLNLLVLVLLLVYLINTYFRSRLYRRLLHLPGPGRMALGIGLVLLSYLAYHEIYGELNQIYTNSSYLLDLKLSYSFYRQPLRLATLAVYLLLAAAYFLVTHLLLSLFIRLHPHWRVGLRNWAIGTLLAAGLLWLLNPSNVQGLFVLSGAYFLLLYLTRLPHALYVFRYQTSIYYFTGAMVCALFGAYVVYHQELDTDVQNKQRYGEEYLAENDKYGEFLLSQMNREIRRDTTLTRLLLDPTLPRERVQQRIRQAHLKNYFDSYDVEVLVFGPDGIPLDNSPDALPLADVARRYRQDRYQTTYPDLYFVNQPGETVPDSSFLKQYVDFVPLGSNKGEEADGTPPGTTPAGTIVLDLKLREAIPQRVYSELLVDSKQKRVPEAASADYSHAIYDPSGRLLVSTGTFNYEKRLPLTVLNGNELYTTGLPLHAYRHLGVKGATGRRIVVSSRSRVFASMYTGFSFLFLVLVVSIVALILGYTVRYVFSPQKVNFATKIQIYLHMAFLLPLLLVVFIAVGIIGTTLSDNQESSYISQTRNASAAFAAQLDAYAKGRISRGYLEQEVKKLASDAGRDVSLFSGNGRLFIPSQPEIYEKGLLSRFINPAAYARIIEDREHEVLLPESLGNLHYKTAYVGLNSYEGRLLGILSVPFYESRVSFDKQILDVVGSILNTFTTVFLVLLVISYFASQSLTVPLRIITQKIRRTNLDKLNEPLDWKSDDEIGLLIGEYNKMLLKLEESKQALSSSEKQSAWREMAKQVAHEILNPLTPMKLTLQQLQRILPNENPNSKRMIDRAFVSLIEQIGNITDIANSFSNFANMPVPRNERFDLVPVVQKAVDLYADDRGIDLQADIRPSRAQVVGDPQLMSRILTNLIINATQSVPAARRPEIRIKLSTGDEFVVLEITDNGTGIPEAIRQKVFMPNFSTKDGGNGVGLAVAKRGVEHANGSIWFQPAAEGSGTTFYISLPLAGVMQAKPEGVVS